MEAEGVQAVVFSVYVLARFLSRGGWCWSSFKHSRNPPVLKAPGWVNLFQPHFLGGIKQKE